MLGISEVTLAGRVLINNSDVSVAEQNSWCFYQTFSTSAVSDQAEKSDPSFGIQVKIEAIVQVTHFTNLGPESQISA